MPPRRTDHGRTRPVTRYVVTFSRGETSRWELDAEGRVTRCVPTACADYWLGRRVGNLPELYRWALTPRADREAIFVRLAIHSYPTETRKITTLRVANFEVLP